jgi:hypothetical protein
MPELDLLLGDVFFEAFEVTEAVDEELGGVDEIMDDSPDLQDARGFASICLGGADGIGEFGVGRIFWKIEL